MSKPKRGIFTVDGVTRVGGKYLVGLVNHRGRRIFMPTSRAGFAKGQRVVLTYHKIKRDHTMVGGRFSKWEPISIDRKKITGKQKRTRSRSFRQMIQEQLNEFREGTGGWDSGVGARTASIEIEGYTVTVDAAKLSWFKIIHKDKPLHFPWARDVATWIERQQKAAEAEATEPQEPKTQKTRKPTRRRKKTRAAKPATDEFMIPLTRDPERAVA